MLSEEIVDVIENGASVLVATCDGERMPECVRAIGARVHPDRATVTIYVARPIAARTLANLAADPRIAASFSRVRDHRTYQLKGTTKVRDAREDERGILEACRAGFAAQIDIAGIPRRVTMGMCIWPAIAIETRVTDAFAQTPGPGAGERVCT